MQLMRTTEFAKRIDVSPRTVRRWIAEGKLPYVKVGNAMRVDVTKVDGFKDEPEQTDADIESAKLDLCEVLALLEDQQCQDR